MALIGKGIERLQSWMTHSIPSIKDDAAKAGTTLAKTVAKDALTLSDNARQLLKTKQLKLVRSDVSAKATRINLHPEVAQAWNQSKLNAARYKEETIGILTGKFGDRLKAEAKYDALYKHFRKEMFIAANYPGSSLLSAIQEGRVRSLYDLSLKDQIAHKGPLYAVGRNLADLRLGLRDHNPLYVTIGGNKKYAKDIAKYGDVMVRYKKPEIAGRVLFSDGNHNGFAKHLFARKDFAESRFTYFDAPHLLVNRIVKEGLDPQQASRLIEGIVYGGINPSRSAEAIKVLKPAAASQGLLEAIKGRGISIIA